MTVEIRMAYDDAAIQALLTSDTGPVVQELRRRANSVLNAARAGCPVNTGVLRASLTMEIVSESGVPVARIGSPLEYLIYVHEGTGVYAGRGPITPKNGTVLRWPGINNSGTGNRRYKGGKTANYVYARSVKGVKGRPFLREALESAL